MKSGFSGRGAIDVSRFKGLGEMSMRDLRDTTMDPPSARCCASRSPPTTARNRGDGRASDGDEARGALRLHSGAGAAGARTRRHLVVLARVRLPQRR